MSSVTPIAEAPRPSLARRRAREIIDQNPGATLIDVVAIAYCEGRVDVAREAYNEWKAKLDAPRAGIHEYDCICQRCGRRAGSRHVVSADAPKNGYFEVVCFHCSAGDDPPRAA